MIDHNTIQRVMDTAQILEVVSDYVALKKAGTVYKGLCPFHGEKSPSFVVSPAKGIFKCFGCGKGGNSINFIMEHEHLAYPEAIRHLAKKYRIEIAEHRETEEDVQQRTDRESMIVVTSFAQKYLVNSLHHTTEGKSIGLSYFYERGFRDDIIHKFGLGYSPEKRDAFTQEALHKGYKKDFLVKTGLSIDGEYGTYDRFHGRVMFPILNLSGAVVGFGGRVMKADKKIAKYVNSIDSDIYHKSDNLFGIYLARNSITKSDRCYMVEGYTDVIQMHQAGVENVVASSGTALTENQIKLVKRFTNNLTMVYDGDAAGIKASLRGIDLVLQAGMNVRAILLPDGDDPDSLARKLTATEFVEFLNAHEQDFIRFKIGLLSADAGDDPVKKAQMVAEIVRSIAVVPDAILRENFIRDASQLLKIREEILHSEVGKRLAQRAESEAKRQNSPYYTREADPHVLPTDVPPTITPLTDKWEYEFMRIMLNHGQTILFTSADNAETNLELEPDTGITVAEYIIHSVQNEEEMQFENVIYSQMFNLYLANMYEPGFISDEYFLKFPDPKVNETAVQMLTSNYILSKYWLRGEGVIDEREIILEEHVPKKLHQYKGIHVKKILDRLVMELQNTTDAERQNELLEKYARVKELDIHLAKLSGRIIG